MNSVGLSATASTAASPNWQQLDVESLSSILASEDGLDSILQLRGEDAAAVADALDSALDSPEIDRDQREIYAFTLRKLCGECGILPTSYTLRESLNIIDPIAYASGGFAEVWKGWFEGRLVAIKSLRTYQKDDPVKVKKRFCKEALVWKRLCHPNVLPFLGTATSPFPFCMVSDWMEHGNAVDYVNHRPTANRLLLLSDVASGLDYLHSMDLVHGDLKGANILINNNHRACLADFGMTRTISGSIAMQSMTTDAGGGSLRWMAPELIAPEDYGFKNSKPSKAGDIYALAMVIYEVMTGNIPFHGDSNWAVMRKVVAGARPERPTPSIVPGLSDPIWHMVEACWDGQWVERPAIPIVSDLLNGAACVVPLSPSRMYIDLIFKASAKWAVLEPYQKRREVGDYGIVNRETGQFEYENNIYQDPRILDNFPNLATEPDFQPRVSDEIEKWIIVSESTKQTDGDLHPSFDINNVADASIKAKFSFKIGTRGAFLVMCRPQSIDLPRDVLPKIAKLKLKVLDGKYMVTEIVSCPAYAYYVSDKSGGDVHLAFVGNDTVAAVPGDKAQTGWVHNMKTGFFQAGYDPARRSQYTPLCTMKRFRNPGEWWNKFRWSYSAESATGKR